MSYKQSRCVFLLCSSLELLSLYDHLLITFLSRNYTGERMSSFLLQWQSRGAARVSGFCNALFSSATDARERFPCEEQWPALKCNHHNGRDASESKTPGQGLLVPHG